MSKHPKKPFSQSAKDIDAGLSGLFDALSDAIGDVVSRLDDGTAGAVSRDHVFETTKGPIRAHAGVKLRMGGQEVSADQSRPQRFDKNTQKSDRQGRRQATAKTKPLVYDMIEDNDTWLITADVPGVTEAEITIAQKGQIVTIQTTGTRRYSAAIDLETQCDAQPATHTLRNGILTLSISKGGLA